LEILGEQFYPTYNHPVQKPMSDFQSDFNVLRKMTKIMLTEKEHTFASLFAEVTSD
jgi:hypothetical protein